MIENAAAHNNQTVKRIALRNSQETFANVIGCDRQKSENREIS